MVKKWVKEGFHPKEGWRKGVNRARTNEDEDDAECQA